MKRNKLLFGLSGGLLCGSLCLAQEPAKPAPPKDAGIAAYVDDKPITTAEVDEKILKNNMKLAQDLYNARKAAVDQVILDRALAKEAADKKVTVDDLVKAKIAEKVKPVTDEDVKTYFDANAARMQGRTLEQVGPQVKTFLTTQRENEARTALLNDVKATAKVRLVLDAPRVEVAVAANDPTKGPANAKVTIIEFSEFQ